MFRSILTVALGIFAPVLWSVACGPSVQSIYEGNIRFEHCYRLDLDLNIAPTHREACWKQWLSSFTYGQPRDRIEYARRRARAFANGDLSRPTLEIGSQKPQEQRQFYLMVPGPTSVYAPPPPIATLIVAQDAGPPTPTPSLPPVPAQVCGRECEASFLSCREACNLDGGAGGAACQSCERDYKRCMKRCLDG